MNLSNLHSLTPGRAKTPSSGFTLIETLVAITILTLSIVGPLYSANRAIVGAQTARSQLTASYLAQEGIEYVRGMRDDEYLAAVASGSSSASDTGWNNFLNNSIADHAAITSCRATTCTLDLTQPMGTGNGFSLQTCSGASCAPLYLLSNGTYTQRSNLGGKITPFTRMIQVVDITGTTDVAGAPYPDKRIVSTVRWAYHNIQYTVSVIDHLTPWQ